MIRWDYMKLVHERDCESSPPRTTHDQFIQTSDIKDYSDLHRTSCENRQRAARNRVRARSPHFAVCLSACAPVLRVLRTFCPCVRPFSEFCGLCVRVRVRSPDFADFLSACASGLRTLRTFCPRARRFSGFCGLFVRTRVRSPDFADFVSACAPVLRILQVFSGGKTT